MIPITYQKLRELFPRGTEDVLQAMSREGDRILAQFGINETANRLCFFLAQIGHESNGVTALEESFYYRSAQHISATFRRIFPTAADAEPYVRNEDGLRRRLFGDPPSYYGRGLIQLTNKDNYEAIGAMVGLPLVEDPDLAARPENVLLIAAAYWSMRQINDWADRGDFDGTSRRINPGERNLAARRAYLATAQRLFGQEAPKTTPGRTVDVSEDSFEGIMLQVGSSGALVTSLQTALKALNYPVGGIDGRYGRVTFSAVQNFQADNNLPVTGRADSATLQKLSHASPRPLEAARLGTTRADLRRSDSRVIKHADMVQNIGNGSIGLGIVGLLNTLVGNDKGGGTTVNTAAAAIPPDVVAANERLAAALKALHIGEKTFTASIDKAGPEAIAALSNWLTIVQSCGDTACRAAGHAAESVAATGNAGLDALINFAQSILPVAAIVAPVGVPAAVVTGVGVGLNLFARLIANARVDEHRRGQNFDR